MKKINKHFIVCRRTFVEHKKRRLQPLDFVDIPRASKRVFSFSQTLESFYPFSLYEVVCFFFLYLCLIYFCLSYFYFFYFCLSFSQISNVFVFVFLSRWTEPSLLFLLHDKQHLLKTDFPIALLQTLHISKFQKLPVCSYKHTITLQTESTNFQIIKSEFFSFRQTKKVMFVSLFICCCFHKLQIIVNCEAHVNKIVQQITIFFQRPNLSQTVCQKIGQTYILLHWISCVCNNAQNISIFVNDN